MRQTQEEAETSYARVVLVARFEMHLPSSCDSSLDHCCTDDGLVEVGVRFDTGDREEDGNDEMLL